MIKSLIGIDGAEPVDFYDKWGFIYLDADERFAPGEKEDDSTSYAEEAGEHRDGRTVDAPFDYTAKFLVEAPHGNLDNVNDRIAAFNYAVRENLGSDVKRKRLVAFVNLHNQVMIVGYPDVIAEATKVYHSKKFGDMDYAEVELKIRVCDPGLCKFNITTEG